jgi:hypothetical protein
MHHLTIQHFTHTVLGVSLFHDHSIDRLSLAIPTVHLPEQECTMRLVLCFLHVESLVATSYLFQQYRLGAFDVAVVC